MTYSPLQVHVIINLLQVPAILAGAGASEYHICPSDTFFFFFQVPVSSVFLITFVCLFVDCLWLSLHMPVSGIFLQVPVVSDGHYLTCSWAEKLCQKPQNNNTDIFCWWCCC